MPLSKVVGEEELEKLLRRLHGKRYGAYKKLRGVVFNYEVAEATFTKIQGDPYAPPSILEITIPPSVHGLPSRFFDEKSAAPFLDLIARELYLNSRRLRRKCGTGNSGYLGVPRPGPWILRRSCVDISGMNIILRIFVGLPARGRRILGNKASEILLDKIPEIVKATLLRPDLRERVERSIENYLDQEYLREWLYENGYAAFIADGSILPRESSYSQKPMKNAVPFKSPPDLRAEVKLPNGRTIAGMAIPMGFTVITGGGYHGKTTLLEAIQDGIYDHIEGDGRELVVSRKRTVSIKAEDGRIVHSVDISSFISDLPKGVSTENFSSLDASGSSSMAASINESIEAGAEVLLIDEDTSATNLLYKDAVMAKIIKREPITPLSSQGRSIVKKMRLGILVIAGASSSLIQAADEIVLMENYRPVRITDEARERITRPISEVEYKPPRRRIFYGIRGLRKVKVSGFKLTARYDDGTVFELDLARYPRIVEKGQINLIAHVLTVLKKPTKPMYVDELIEHFNKLLKERGFQAFADPVPPDLTIIDGFDLIWVLNRIYNASFDIA